MPLYTPSDEELGWYLYCIRRNIQVSPGGINGDPENWRIAVNTSGTWHNSPKTYNRVEIWEAYYKVCEYYYKKKTK